jgi:outer membrane protein OmpA-like peptidoglycan-associated protein
MTTPFASAAPVRAAAALIALATTLLLAACAAPKQAAVIANELPFEQAVAQATDALVGQTRRLPGFLARVEDKVAKRGVVVDPSIDAGSGQQTAATALMDQRVGSRMTTQFDSIEILPFETGNLAKAAYLLTGTLTRVAPAPGAAAGKRPLQINLALTDLRNGNVVAQASALARDEGLDHTPARYYQDSPILVKDKVVDGYIRTAATPPGQAADPFYFERVAVATVINEANQLYNAEKYADALAKYRAAGGTAGGDQLRTLNGIYLAQSKLGRTAEAEAAFGNIVAFGLKNNQLGVKFLFSPGSTAFWADPRISGPYAMWLRQIAKEADSAKVCMTIVGHTSRTGSEAVNDALSLQRAGSIQQRLAAETAALGTRIRTAGVGFRENLIGSGTDNAIDALDRRVEFKISPCGAAG